LFSVKNANIFAEFFGENIFKIITSAPGDITYVIKTHVICTQVRLPWGKC
jgi:hypothetical protein